MAINEDWVEVGDEELCTKDDWVLLAGDEGVMSAVFVGRASAGIGGGVPPPLPAAAPADAAASSNGRVLFCGAWSRYYVLDPSAPVPRHALPPPRRPRCPLDAAIASDGRGGYLVVRAFEDFFEIYSSATGEWRLAPVPKPAAAADGVVPGSAAAFAGSVFWKTAAAEASRGVLALHVASSRTRQIAPPPGSSSPGALWQLGVAGGHLCAAVCAGDEVQLYGLVDGDVWKLLHAVRGLPVGEDARARPLHFESDHLEVLLRIGARVVAFDVVQGGDRDVRLEGIVLPKRDEAIVPWCRALSTVKL